MHNIFCILQLKSRLKYQPAFETFIIMSSMHIAYCLVLSLSHQVHFTVALIEILISIVFGAFVLIKRLAIKVCYHTVQVNAVTYFLSILVGTIPFEISDIVSNM